MLSVEGLDLHYGDAQALAGVTLDVVGCPPADLRANE